MTTKSNCPFCDSVLPDVGECLNCLLALGLKAPGENGPAARNAFSGTRVARIADCDILDEVARGASGLVFRARQKEPERIVALKVLSKGQFASLAELARFKQEIESASALAHAHIVPIYGAGEHEGHPFFTMRFIEGGNLSRRINDFRRNPRKAAELMVKITTVRILAAQQQLVTKAQIWSVGCGFSKYLLQRLLLKNIHAQNL